MLFQILFCVSFLCVGSVGWSMQCSAVHESFGKSGIAIQNAPPRPRADSPEWKRVSVRDPALPLQDRNYLTRLHEGTYEIFAPWFEKEGSLQNLPFEEIIRLQHNLLVVGRDGQGRYNGATRVEHKMSPSPDIRAGRFRHEFHPGVEGRNVFAFRYDLKLKGRFSQRLKRLVTTYLKISAPDKPEEPEEPVLDFFGGPHASIDVLRLPGVDPRVQTWNRIYGKYMTHYYPKHADVPLILKTMDGLLTQLKELSKKRNASQSQVLDLVDQYLYLGIHAHPFESANFSLIMSHVNYILARFGWSGVSHSNLDWIGLSEQFPEFRSEFRAKLRDANPEMTNGRFRPFKGPNLSVLAHLEDVGDAYFQEGSIVEMPGQRKNIEGLLIASALPENIQIEYMAHVAHQGDSQWVSSGQYVGTWGQHRALEGLAIRISGPGSKLFDVVYQARVGERDWTSICSNGQYCGTRDQGRPLTAIRIEIVPKKN